MSLVIKYFVKFDATTLITTFLVSTKTRENIFTYISVCRFVLPSILHFPWKTRTFWCIFTNLPLTVTRQYLTYFFNRLKASFSIRPHEKRNVSKVVHAFSKHFTETFFKNLPLNPRFLGV